MLFFQTFGFVVVCDSNGHLIYKLRHLRRIQKLNIIKFFDLLECHTVQVLLGDFEKSTKNELWVL